MEDLMKANLCQSSLSIDTYPQYIIHIIIYIFLIAYSITYCIFHSSMVHKHHPAVFWLNPSTVINGIQQHVNQQSHCVTSADIGGMNNLYLNKRAEHLCT